MDFLFLPYYGTLEQLVEGSVVLIWDTKTPAICLGKGFYSTVDFLWRTSSKHGKVGFVPGSHEDQVYVRRDWWFMVLD